MSVYCTTYCNHGHRLSDGKPVGHGCFILPPSALQLEMAGDYEGAVLAIESLRTSLGGALRPHRGVRQSKPYNGHKNWNHWNVSLWINNDEGLYALAKDCIRRAGARTQRSSRSTSTLDRAAEMFLDALNSDAPDWTKPHTKDGAPFTKTSVRAALRGL